jgi:ParB family chromosome partitioning protein
MKRQALGKGLSSLIPTPDAGKADAGLLLLDIDLITPGRYQPRVAFKGLEGLADSIRENGIMQPVVVRREGERYQLIAGERRWRAAQMAGVHKIPAVVRVAAEDRLLELSLIENIQREDLNPIEEAKAYEVLLSQMNLAQTEIARRVGRDRSSISNSLRLLKLSDYIQELIREGSISTGHAKAILAISDAETQIKVADEVVAKLLSVRETEALVAAMLKRSGAHDGAAKRRDATAGHPDPNVRAAEDRLCRALGTKVRIVKRGKRGKIEIDFYSDGELDRLFSVLTATRSH